MRARIVRGLRALVIGLVVLATLCVFAFALVHDSLIDEALFARPLDPIRVTDRDGIALRHTLPESVDRSWVGLADTSPEVVQAFLAAEDARFYEHGAVDPRALLRAVAVDLVPGGRVSGASTITQQVVKMVYGRPRGLWEKPLEVARAIELERRFTKDEILEQYLNRVPMGNGIFGVERASEAYFGRPSRELSLGEAAMLAGIPQAPSITEPRRHLDRARRRQAYVLEHLASMGWRSEEEISRAAAQPIEIATSAPRPFRAPRFVDRVLTARREHGIASASIQSSLSWPLTDELGRALASGVAPLRSRGASNAAAVIVANQTGEILAYVGAADESGEGGALDLLAARRQPGSTLKPFAYALFFESGATPATPVDDLRRAMTGRAGALYLPGDFDGRERGPVPARLALASSLNLAALDVVTRVGSDRFVDRLVDLGLTRAASADRDSAAMVLGGIDVTGLELAGAYATLARGGTRVPLSIFRTEPVEGERVIEASAARLVTDVLSDAAARRAGFGRDLESLASDDVPFALKTGTSTGFHDAWAAVYDADFTVLVWVGDPSGEPMESVSGFEGAAPLAVRGLALARARRDELISSDAAPQIALATISVCAQTGLLPGPHCHHVVRERFDPAAIPVATCHGHDEDGALALAPRYAEWARRARPSGVVIASTHAAHATAPRVAYPHDGATLLAPSNAAPEITLRTAAGEDDARFEVDGARLRDARYRLRPGHHVVVATLDGRRSAPVAFDVLTN